MVYYDSAKAFIALCGQEKPGKFIDSAARRDECVTMWRIVFRVTIRAFPGPLLNMGEIAPSFFSMKPTGAKRKRQMNKLVMVAGAIALAGIVSGCATTGAAGDDKVGAWQKSRTPVAVLESKIEVKAAGAIVEALDVAPFGIYKAIADKVDGMATMDRSRRAYQMYVGTIQELVEQGKTKEEALKEANAQLDSVENSAQLRADIKAYLAEAEKTDFQACLDWAAKIGEELQLATQKFTEEASNALSQIIEIAQNEGGMAALKIPAQAKDDLAVVGNQLADSVKGLAIYVELVNADKNAAAMQVEYPIEG